MYLTSFFRLYPFFVHLCCYTYVVYVTQMLFMLHVSCLCYTYIGYFTQGPDKDVNYYKTLMAGMKKEFEAEIEKVRSHVRKEKTR